LFKLRTFDVYWVEKSALMYRDGFDKVRFKREKSNELEINFFLSRGIQFFSELMFMIFFYSQLIFAPFNFRPLTEKLKRRSSRFVNDHLSL
jgi:hypothetical protein